MREINEKKKRQLTESRGTGVRRKPYAKPKLEVFGRVRDLTMGTAGSAFDAFARRTKG